MSRYTRIWDVHLTDSAGWYDFPLYVIPAKTYFEKSFGARFTTPAVRRQLLVSRYVKDKFKPCMREALDKLGQFIDAASEKGVSLEGISRSTQRRDRILFRSMAMGFKEQIPANWPEANVEMAEFASALIDAGINLLDAAEDQIETHRSRATGSLSKLRGFQRDIEAVYDMLAQLDRWPSGGPQGEHISTVFSMEQVQNKLADDMVREAVQWITDTGHVGKLRVSSHGDGYGNLFMRDDKIRGDVVAQWLHNNGLTAERSPTGTRQDVAGTKGANGLVTIALVICKGGLFTEDTEEAGNRQKFSTGQREELYTKPATNSAVYWLTRQLQAYGLTGIEVTGSNMKVIEKGGEWGDEAEGEWKSLRHSPHKVRAIS